ncbi:MAG: hypothetical protein IT314_00005 [Anaerolineales bacterium]|nr:hypothetical protein [Anaerolineales bacterium]
MNSNRKYFGMTVPQLGVLAGLAGALLLILCVGGYLILGGGLNALSPQPIVPPIVNSTATRVVPPTATLTPPPTAIPYEQLIPQGWVQHKTATMEIWVPTIFKKTQIKLPEGTAITATIELVASQAASSKNLYSEWVFVAYEPLTSATLEEFLDTSIQSLPLTVRVVERRKVVLNGTEAIRLTSEVRINNLDFNELDFVFLDGSAIWYVSYLAQINDFYQLLPEFEKSILTFRLLK